MTNFDRFSTRPKSADSELRVVFGRNVRAARTSQHLSVTRLAYMADVSRSLIAKIESGSADVRLSYVQRIADVLCVNPLELLGKR